MRAKLTVGSTVLLLGLAASASASTNLVVNGGFETGDFSGWTLSGNLGYTFVSSSPNNPHSGSYAAQLGAVGSDDILSQTISTKSGILYNLSFWHIYDPLALPPGDFSVEWDGDTIYGPIVTTDPPSPQVWTEYTFSVVGTGEDTLSFYSRNDPSYQGLDDVSVSAGGVPEPAAWVMMLLGFAGVGVAMRRRPASATLAF